MDAQYPLKITGLGRYLPDRVVTNDELEELCGLDEGRIAASNAGVHRRRWAEDETTRSMGAEAARRAVDDAGIDWDDVDLLVNASAVPAQVMPDAAPLIQRELGLGESGMNCLSVRSNCLGFLAGLDVVGSFLVADRCETAVIINSELASKGLNFDQPESAILFGDAATAVVVRRSCDGEDARIERVHFETYGVGADLTEVRGGGTRNHPNEEATSREDNLFSMQGGKVFEVAMRYLPGFLQAFDPDLLTSKIEEIDRVVPHQASKAGLQAFSALGVSMNDIAMTIEKYGNCVSASLPLTLCEEVEEGRIERGDRLLLIGSGAGISFGAMTVIF